MSEIGAGDASEGVVTTHATVPSTVLPALGRENVPAMRSAPRRNGGSAIAAPVPATSGPARPGQASNLEHTLGRKKSRRERRHAQQDEILETYEAHHRELVRFAALVAPEPAMAEDLVQEAFVKLYAAWRRIEDPARVGGYLRSTVLNLARGRARHLGVIRRSRPEPRPDAASAESRAIVNDDRDRVVTALRHLSDRQQACLVLRHYEDRSESEIADILDISIGPVRTHVHRGMRALASILGEPVEAQA
jgi:RNA polymerase sigma-70 factor (sigma-E family)